MNRAKSIFIGFYPMLMMGIMSYALWRLRLSGDIVAWGGPLLTVIPFTLFLSWVMLFKNVARTSATFPGLNVLALLGVALGAYASLLHGVPAGPLPFVLALVGAVSFALYSLWYSRLGRKPAAKLVVGRELPDLELKTADDRTFHTRELRGRPALIFFYRGNWCPLCMAQVKEVAARYREIEASGARVLLVSPQPQEKTAALARRFDVPFEFLVDEGNRAARTLDIEMKNGLPLGMSLLGYDSDTVFPTVIVLDATGVVRWIDQTDNYRVRPEPDTFVPLLRRLATATIVLMLNLLVGAAGADTGSPPPAALHVFQASGRAFVEGLEEGDRFQGRLFIWSLEGADESVFGPDVSLFDPACVARFGRGVQCAHLLVVINGVVLEAFDTSSLGFVGHNVLRTADVVRIFFDPAPGGARGFDRRASFKIGEPIAVYKVREFPTVDPLLLSGFSRNDWELIASKPFSLNGVTVDFRDLAPRVAGLFHFRLPLPSGLPEPVPQDEPEFRAKGPGFFILRAPVSGTGQAVQSR